MTNPVAIRNGDVWFNICQSLSVCWVVISFRHNIRMQMRAICGRCSCGGWFFWLVRKGNRKFTTCQTSINLGLIYLLLQLQYVRIYLYLHIYIWFAYTNIGLWCTAEVVLAFLLQNWTLSIRQNVINGNNYMMGYVYMTCKIKISMFLKVHNNITCG